jgi:hypothetical protein
MCYRKDSFLNKCCWKKIDIHQQKTETTFQSLSLFVLALIQRGLRSEMVKLLQDKNRAHTGPHGQR